MDRRHFLALTGALGLGAFMFGGVSGCAGGPAGPVPGAANQLADAVVPFPAGADALEAPIGAFADTMAAHLAPETRNLVWSPWSVAMVLAMVRDGAAGATASEFTSVLSAGEDFDARLADGWQRMAHAEGEPLHAANAVWSQRGLTFNPPFRDQLTALAASLKVAAFATAPAAATQEINAWVADHTVDKIPELLKPGLVGPDTRMVLVNAAHFKAAWATAFNQAGDAPFATPTGSVQVPFLSGAETFTGWKADGWTAAQIPCEHGEFALTVALPDAAGTNPATVPTSVLTAGHSSPVPNEHAVVLRMTAWKLRYSVTLNDALQAAGIREAFTSAADFSPMTSDEALFLDWVVHEAMIDVNANGIEAAAATAAGMRASGMALEPLPLNLDRPFAYALVHLPTGTPVFIGSVADPSTETAA
jgi:serpin B